MAGFLLRQLHLCNNVYVNPLPYIAMYVYYVCIHLHMYVYVTGPAKINHVSSKKSPIFSACSIITYELFVQTQ